MLGTCNVPLEPLLENRIGIRGWLPIQSSNDLTNDTSTSGGLEVVIRFTKHCDHLKVIDTARDIGWTSTKNFTSPSRKLEKNGENRSNKTNQKGKNKSFLHQLTLGLEQTVKCLIEIEKAVHLPLINDEIINMNCLPSSFVTFELTNQSDSIRTKVCADQVSPVWSFQHEMDLDSEFFLDEEKLFTLKIWHDGQGSNEKLLGTASVDLTPLVYGLSHISGWYNIQDSVGNCQGKILIKLSLKEKNHKINYLIIGQIKLSLIPKENLKTLRDQVSKRNKSTCDKKTFSSRFSSTSCSSLNVMAPLNSRCSGSNSNLDEIDAKNGLAKNLNELDQFNKIFNERLNKNCSNINEDLFRFVKEKAEKCIRKTDDILKDNSSNTEVLEVNHEKGHKDNSNNEQLNKSQHNSDENIKDNIQVSYQENILNKFQWVKMM